MRLTIKSRRYRRDIDFIASVCQTQKTHYAYVKVSFEGDDSNYRPICDGGYLIGSTISASAESFEYVCRQWWKQYLRNTKEYFYKDPMRWCRKN